MKSVFKKMMKRKVAIFAGLLAFFAAPAAFAIATPVAGDFAFEIYDLVVNDILNGAIGFVGGVIAIVYGASQLMRSWMVAILGIVGGAIILSADVITGSLGFVL